MPINCQSKGQAHTISDFFLSLTVEERLLSIHTLGENDAYSDATVTLSQTQHFVARIELPHAHTPHKAEVGTASHNSAVEDDKLRRSID